MIVSTIPGHSYFINSPVDGTVSTADGSIPLLAFKAGVQVDFSAPADAVRVLPDDSRIIVRENFKSAPARAAAAPAGADVTPEQIAAWDAASAKWTATPFTAGKDAQALGCGLAIGTIAEAYEASVAVGHYARATTGNIAIGADSLACAVDTTVLGTCASAMANGSTVVGAEAYTAHSQNVIIGAKARASNTESVVVGYQAVAQSGYGSVAVGAHARATYGHSVVVGNSSSLEGYCYPGTLVGPNLTPPAHIYSPVAVLGAGSTCISEGQLAIFFYRKAGDVFMGFQTQDGSNAPVYKEVSMTNLFNLVQ